MRCAVVVGSLVLVTASCHLADDPELRCASDQHVSQGRCVANSPDGTVVTIAAAVGTACNTVSPTSITTTTDGAFRFKNDDTADHVVRGVDGQVWATAKAGAYSDYVGLTKVGSWQYDVDGCAKVGVVVVE